MLYLLLLFILLKKALLDGGRKNTQKADYSGENAPNLMLASEKFPTYLANLLVQDRKIFLLSK